MNLDSEEFENEWSEIFNMKKKSSDENKDQTKSAQPASVQPLIFLEDIHIFALANLLMRPIIILSQKNISDLQRCDLRGIYLPLLRQPEECVKDPILIAYHNFHFMPLVLGMDEELYKNEASGVREFVCSDKLYHFKNVDAIELKNVSNEEYESLYRFDDASKRYINALPLIGFDLEMMKVHFMKEIEEKNSTQLLKNYLK